MRLFAGSRKRREKSRSTFYEQKFVSIDTKEFTFYNELVFVVGRERDKAPSRLRHFLSCGTKNEEPGKDENKMKTNLPKDVEIAALLPAYTQEGDVTRILLTNGTELVYRRTVRSTLTKLARRRCKDVTLLRRWASRYTHRALNNPIAASADLVLVPVKTRRPRVEGDGTMAHVNVVAISGDTFRQKTKPRGKNPTVIALAGGSKLPVLWSEKTTLAHIREARHICAELVREEEEAVLRRLRKEK